MVRLLILSSFFFCSVSIAMTAAELTEALQNPCKKLFGKTFISQYPLDFHLMGKSEFYYYFQIGQNGTTKISIVDKDKNEISVPEVLKSNIVGEPIVSCKNDSGLAKVQLSFHNMINGENLWDTFSFEYDAIWETPPQVSYSHNFDLPQPAFALKMLKNATTF